MDVLLSKLLVQALGQCPDRMLPSGKRTSGTIPPDTRRGSSEDQSSPCTRGFRYLVSFEGRDGFTRKGKSCFNVLKGLLNVIGSYFEERLEDFVSDVKDRCTDGVLWGTVFGANRAPCSRHVLSCVGLHGESSGL